MTTRGKKMKWNYIRNKQPENNEWIFRLEGNFEDRYGYRVGFQKFSNHYSCWEEWVDFYKSINCEPPDFYWVYMKDFPFPDQPERTSEKDHSEAIVEGVNQWLNDMRCSEHSNERE